MIKNSVNAVQNKQLKIKQRATMISRSWINIHFNLFKITSRLIHLYLKRSFVSPDCKILDHQITDTIYYLLLVKLVTRNKLVLRNPFPWPICNLLRKDKEHFALRNNFRVTKKFLIAKFDCTLHWCSSEKNQKHMVLISYFPYHSLTIHSPPISVTLH